MLASLLTAIGLTAAFSGETELRMRLGLPIIDRAFFLKSACPCFLLPAEFMRAMQCGVQFSAPPPQVKLGLVGEDRGQNGLGPGREHRVAAGAQRIYPLRGNPK